MHERTVGVKRLAVCCALFILGVIVLADLGMLGILKFLNGIPYADKAGHFLLYGILALLINLALFRMYPGLSPNLLAFRSALTLILFIGLEEFSQHYFPNRSFDLLDLTFSYLGVFFFSVLALKLKRS
jgi:VanZ family protein